MNSRFDKIDENNDPELALHRFVWQPRIGGAMIAIVCLALLATWLKQPWKMASWDTWQFTVGLLITISVAINMAFVAMAVAAGLARRRIRTRESSWRQLRLGYTQPRGHTHTLVIIPRNSV